MACLIVLNDPDLQASLNTEFFLSDFADQLDDAYRGSPQTDYPETALLVSEINNNILPKFLPGKYDVQSLQETISNPENMLALQTAFSNLMLTKRQLNLKAQLPSYFVNFDLVGSLLSDLQEKKDQIDASIAEKQEAEATKDDSVVLSSIGDYGNYVHERNYAEYKNYAEDRFKNSKTVERMVQSKFIGDVFLKNVFIDVDKGVLIDQTQRPNEVSQIDKNLKEYRINLLKDLLTRLDISDADGQPVKYSDKMLTYKGFEDVLRSIADRVISTKYKGTNISLDAPGTLFQLAEENKINPSSEASTILKNFTDFTILADFNKMFDYYAEGSLSVSRYNDDFDPKIRKYAVKNALSIDAINASWDEKVQDGVDLAAPLYKTIINNTPIINYTTGRETAVNLYPTQVQAVFAQYFSKIDRHNPTESIRTLIMQSLRDPAIMRTDKNVIYTMYKKFFEIQGDSPVVQLKGSGNPATNNNDKVASFYNTIRDNADQSLMYLITKPLMETSKVFYLEAIEDNGVNKVSDSAVKLQTQVRYTASRAIDNALNKSYEEFFGDNDDVNDNGFVGKYDLKFGTDNTGPLVKFKSPINGQEYILRPTGNDLQDVRTLRELSKDMLGFDFDGDKRYAELWEEILSLNGPDDEVPNVFTGYLYDALQVVKAKIDLYNEDNQKTLADGGRLSNEFLMKAIDRAGSNFNVKFPENFRLQLQTENAQTINKLLYTALNNYTGNQLKSIVNTVEGTQVAGYATYNYFNGIKQNHADHRLLLRSAARPVYDRSPLAENLLINDENLLDKFYIRGAAKVGPTIKSNQSQNVLETVNFNVNLGYFGRIASALKEGTNPVPVFDVTVYSDKSINPLPAINNRLLVPSQGYVNLFTTDAGIAMDEEHTLGLHYKSTGHYYRAYGNNILNTWSEIYGKAGFSSVFDKAINSKNSISDKLTALNELNEGKDSIWYKPGLQHNMTGYPAARYYASQAGVTLNNWVDFDNSAKTIGPKTKLLIKSDLIANIAHFDKNINEVSDSFRAKLNKELVNFANELNEMNFKLDGPAREAISKMYPGIDTNFVYDQELTITKNRTKAQNITDINPAIRKMFYDYNLIQDNLMLSTLGPIYAHKGTNENKMWITQIKRNVAATASIKNYSLGLERGVEDFTTTAFVDELQNYAKTVLGDNHDIQSFDGASFETMTQRMKTWHSLNDRFNGNGGEVHKSFISHFDPKTGAFGETKHAAFALTNDFIRQSKGANIDWFNIHKDLYRGDISKVDITNSWKDGVNLKTFNDVLYLRRDLDFKTGRTETLYALNSIEYTGKDADGNAQYNVTTQNLSSGEEPKTTQMQIPTFYDLWKVLGDIDSVEPTDEKTSHFVFDSTGRNKIYYRDNVKSAEKLLDFESYIGNKGETIVPEAHISDNNDVRDGYKVYNTIFGGNGFVNTHQKLIEQAFSINPNKPEQLALLHSALKGTESKLNALDFAIISQHNSDELKALFDHVTTAKLVKPYQRFKGSNVDRISIAGAQKVGQFNINNLSTIHAPSRNEFLQNAGLAADPGVPGMTILISHPISNFNAGIQLSAWHETEGAHVTTPTQMLNALIFNAKRLGKVSQMYEAIGSIVDQELTYLLGGRAMNIPQLVQGLTNAQFYAQNKDELLRIFKDIMRTKVEKSQDDEFTLESTIVELFDHKDFPIDDSQIFQSAVAELTNYFTTSGIRTKFDGMFAIIHPASDVLQFHDVRGGFVPVKNDRGGFDIKALAYNETRTMQMYEYSQYKKLNEHLALNDANPDNRVHAANAQTLNEKPRNLRGQQVQIKFADGTTQDLSILNGAASQNTDEEVRGGRHLIPEAHALDLVKRVISDFKDNINSSGYKSLSDAEKIAELDKQYKNFIKKLDSKPGKDGIGGLIQNHPAVAHSFNSFANDLANVIDLKKAKNSKQHLFEWAYENFSQSKEARDKKIKNSSGENLVFAKEHEYIDKLNTVGIVFLKRLQLFLDYAQNGYTDAAGTTSFIPGSLKDKTLYENADKLDDAQIQISRAEAIAPITAKQSFMVREGDSIGDITQDLMEKRLNESLDYLDVNADAVLLSQFGKKIYLHEGAPAPGTKANDRHKNISYYERNKWFTNDSGERLFQIPNGMLVTNINGNLHIFLNDNYAIVNNPLLKNLNAGFGRQGDRFNIELLGDKAKRESSKAVKQAQNKEKAAEMYSSWVVYLEKLIGTRVPGQHFQSFQGMKIVGFSASVAPTAGEPIEGNNNIYVADEVILLSGADFDIDKQNIIYHSINSDGTMALWHPAGNRTTPDMLRASLELPMPSGRKETDFAAQTDLLGNSIDRTLKISDDADMANVHILNGIYHMLDQGYKIDKNLNPNILAKLVEYDNAHTGEIPLFPITTEAIRNFAISNTNQIIESPSNFVYLSTGVTTDTIKQFSSRVPRQKTANDTRKENPVSQARQKYENMMGKAGIGIMASAGMKVASAVTFATNKALFDIGQLNHKYLAIDNLIKNYEYHLNGITSPDSLYVGEHSVAEIKAALDDLNRQKDSVRGQMIYLLNAIGGDKLTLPNINYDLLPEEFNELSMFSSLHRTSIPNEEFIRPDKALDYAKLASSFDPDMADQESQLLSSATDNAKELDLGKINGTPDFLTIYPSSFLQNRSLEQLTDTMTSPMIEMLMRNAGKNVFDKSTASNSVGKLLGHVNTLLSETSSEDRKVEAIGDLEQNYNLVLSGANTLRDKVTGEIFSLSQLGAFKALYHAPAQISTLLAKYLGINQGIPSNNWGLYSFATQLQDTVNAMFEKAKSPTVFNFKTFLDSLANNGQYHRGMIAQTSPLFAQLGVNFNPLFVLTTNPHFAKQLTAFNSSNTILRESSYRVNSMYHIVEKLRKMGYLGKNQNVNMNDFQEIEKFLEGAIIESFIDNEYYNNYGTLNEHPVFYNGERRMELNNPDDRELFLDWMKTKFYDNVRSLDSMRNNTFIQDLTVDDRMDPLLFDKIDFIKLQQDTTNVKNNLQQGHYRDAYIYALKEVYDKQLTDLQHDDKSKQNNVFNALFWYNLIVNKNNITKNSYAKLLGDVLWKDNAEANIYTRLFLLKGRIGKSTNVELNLDAEPEQDDFWKMSISGVNLNLKNMFLTQQIGFTREEPRARMDEGGDGDQDYSNLGDEFGYNPDEVEHGDVGDDITGDNLEVDINDIVDTSDDTDIIEDDEEAPREVRNKLTVLRTVQKGNPGTRVTLTLNKQSETVDVNVSSASLPVLASRNVQIQSSVGYNPWIKVAEELRPDQDDAYNYYKMSLINIHDLLSRISGSNVQITYTLNGQQVTEQFNPNKDYKC